MSGDIPASFHLFRGCCILQHPLVMSYGMGCRGVHCTPEKCGLPRRLQRLAMTSPLVGWPLGVFLRLWRAGNARPYCIFGELREQRACCKMQQALRVSKNPQTVKMRLLRFWGSLSHEISFAPRKRFLDGWQKACFARYFDLLRKTNLTVPSYADRFVLLVFGAPSTSLSLSKNSFSTD